MTKRILSLLLALMLCASLVVCASAVSYDGDDNLLLIDSIALLSNEEYEALRSKLEEISHTYGAQVCVGTMETLNGEDIDIFVERWYDELGLGYGKDKAGVLLLVSLLDREYRILSNGFAADAISLSAIDNISNAIVSDLSDGNWADAFTVYAEKCEYYLDGHVNGFPFKAGRNLIIALVIGLAAAFIVTGIWKAQLKSVRKQNQANVYVKPGSLQLTQSGDYFLYRNVSKTQKQSSSSSSSGSSRNIGGGKF